jgi:hypothetical protein
MRLHPVLLKTSAALTTGETPQFGDFHFHINTNRPLTQHANGDRARMGDAVMERAIATPSELRFAVNRATQLRRLHHNACVTEQAQRELLTHLMLRRALRRFR